MSKVRAGAWALESELAEAEERERSNVASVYPVLSAGHSIIPAGELAQSFPSTQEAATKPKKKKGVPLTLSQFTTGTYDGPGGARRGPGFEPKGPTANNLLPLPTGPRQHTAEELVQTSLGGGFRSYGYGTGGGNGAGYRRRPDFGLDDEPRRNAAPTRASDLEPSRVYGVDDRVSTKVTPTMNSDCQERYGSFRNGCSSKADELDNWSLEKKSATLPPSRYSSVSDLGSDGWVRGGRVSLSSNGDRERPMLVLNPPKGDYVSPKDPFFTRPSPFGAARPREEVLAEKGLDWRKMETEIEAKKAARPTSSQSSRPSSVQSSRPESPVSQVLGGAAPKSRTKMNPFGDAKPREVLLEEKGMDWRKIDLDLEHRGVDRPERDEEKMLKEEIDRLKEKLANETEGNIDRNSALNSTEQVSSLHLQIVQMERELSQLIRELDDKVRFGQRASFFDIRPGSRSGGVPSSAGRPASHSGILDDSRIREFRERPRSRGMGNMWSRPPDEHRGFLRRRDSGFLAGRSTERSCKISGRW